MTTVKSGHTAPKHKRIGYKHTHTLSLSFSLSLSLSHTQTYVYIFEKHRIGHSICAHCLMVCMFVGGIYVRCLVYLTVLSWLIRSSIRVMNYKTEWKEITVDITQSLPWKIRREDTQAENRTRNFSDTKESCWTAQSKMLVNVWLWNLRLFKDIITSIDDIVSSKICVSIIHTVHMFHLNCLCKLTA